MADRTIKPDDTNDLVLQNNDGSAKLELNEDQTIVLTGGSSTAATITSGGDVMIGATDGSGSLFVKGTSTTADRVKLENSGGSGKITVKDSSGTETITLSGGSGLITGTTFSGDGAINFAETYRLNSSTSMGTNHTLKDWAITGGNYGSSNMTINTTTGSITPPSTGFYIISVSGMVYNDSSSTPRFVEISHRFGGAEYLRHTSNIADGETGHYTQITSNFIYDWTSTSTALTLICVAEQNVTVNGSSSLAFTTATFMKIGDT